MQKGIRMKHRFFWKTKDQYGLGNRCEFQTSEYIISVIDDGYGSDKDLYEMAVLSKSSSEFVSLPGITESDGVRGWLSLDECDMLLIKIASLTGENIQSISVEEVQTSL